MATAKKKAPVKKVEEKNYLSAAAAAAKAKLEAAAAEYEKIISNEKAEVIKAIKAQVKSYGIEAKQIFGNVSVEKKSTDFKYFDPVSKVGWSGKGKAKPVFEKARKAGTLDKYLVSEKKS